jgi:hypothetical protein
MLTPVISEGNRSGVHWTRRKLAAEAQRQRARQHRLAHAGHIFEQHVPFAQQRNDQRVDDLLFADNDFLDVGAEGFCKLLNFSAHAHHRFCGRRRWAHRFMASVCPRTVNLSAPIPPNSFDADARLCYGIGNQCPRSSVG